MGGDHGPQVVVPAALRALRAHDDLKIAFVGNQDVLTPLLKARGRDLTDRWSIHHTTEVVGMDELPSQALRNKKYSSMRVAINLVNEGQAEACVSAGNTGALMATARFVLKTVPGIDRPAIVTRFPTKHANKEVYVLDLGANVDSSAEQLHQFAVMGSILAASVHGNAAPRVGLLNIGAEEIKGNEQVKRTAELLSQNKAIHYIGFVEGDGIFAGEADVVVCDGFVGNIALKACEGIAKLMGGYIKEAFNKNILTRLAGMMVFPILKKVQTRMDPRLRNGAILIGLNGIVIKSHGSAGVIAFAAAIEEALLEVEKNVPQRIREHVGAILEEG